MREIKFRAWDKTNKVYYKSIWNLMWKIGGIRFAWDDYVNSDGETMITDLVDGDYELMQYTGLHDKNGKEVWEGDIVKFYYLGWHTSEVVYMSDGFYVKTNGHIEDVRENLGLAFPFKDIEIIGNVFEHPHLLTTNTPRV